MLRETRLLMVSVIMVSFSLGLSNNTMTTGQADNGVSQGHTLDNHMSSNWFTGKNDTGTHGSGGATGVIDKQTVAEGRTREYRLYVPSVVGKQPGPFPLFIYLHGAGYDKTQGEMFFGGRADSDGFIIASPSGDYQKSWREIYTTRGNTQTYYDTKLIRVILNETFPLYNIDLSNIWVGGWSDGGALSLRAGSLMSDILSTVTHQTGGWGPDWANAQWTIRKSMSFYSRVGETDSGFRQDLEGARDHFTQAGFEFKFELIPGWGHGWRNENEDLFPDWAKAHPLPHNWIRPAITFSRPLPGEKWEAGTKNTVEWWLGCGNPSYQVKLELSTSGASGPWTLIDTITQQTWGAFQYEWTIPDSTPATTNAVLRATITDSSTPQKTNISVMNYTFEITPSQGNKPPVVNAGPDQTIYLGDTAWLNGTVTDPENDPLTLTWSKESGPGAVNFADTKSARTTATFTADGEYILKLEASDGKNPPVSDTVTVKVLPKPVTNRPPVLSSVGDKTVAEGETLTISLHATDPDNDRIVYSAAGLPKNAAIDPGTGIFRFDPDYNQSGEYQVTFTASDGKGGSDSETIKITVTNTNRLPVARVNAPGEVKVGERVTLDGSGSYDPDGDTLTFEWRQVSGPGVSLTGASASTPSFTPKKEGTYVFELVVRDEESPSSPVQVSIIARGTSGGQTGNQTKDKDAGIGTTGLLAVICAVSAILIIVVVLLMKRGKRHQPQPWQQVYTEQYWTYPQDPDQQWNETSSNRGPE